MNMDFQIRVENEIESPYLNSMKQKRNLQRFKEAKKQNSKSGLWSVQQNLIYADFIDKHPHEFQTAQKRRRYKVFQRMALYLPRRTAVQCRSHNQKMVKFSGGNIMKVSEYIRSKLSQKQKQEYQQLLKKKLKPLDPETKKKIIRQNRISRIHGKGKCQRKIEKKQQQNQSQQESKIITPNNNDSKLIISLLYHKIESYYEPTSINQNPAKMNPVHNKLIDVSD